MENENISTGFPLLFILPLKSVQTPHFLCATPSNASPRSLPEQWLVPVLRAMISTRTLGFGSLSPLSDLQIHCISPPNSKHVICRIPSHWTQQQPPWLWGCCCTTRCNQNQPDWGSASSKWTADNLLVSHRGAIAEATALTALTRPPSKAANDLSLEQPLHPHNWMQSTHCKMCVNIKNLFSSSAAKIINLQQLNSFTSSTFTFLADFKSSTIIICAAKEAPWSVFRANFSPFHPLPLLTLWAKMSSITERYLQRDAFFMYCAWPASGSSPGQASAHGVTRWRNQQVLIGKI